VVEMKAVILAAGKVDEVLINVQNGIK